jgi:hypothetical protein
MKILAIDPGPDQSGFVVWDGTIVHADTVPNETMRVLLRENLFGGHGLVAIEMIASYVMAVGAEVFDTCVWIGRFIERAKPVPVRLVFRKDIKIHLCGTHKAKDGNIRQALIDKHGPTGTKKAPGKLYGISGHLWAALAVADFVNDNPNPSDA